MLPSFRMADNDIFASRLFKHPAKSAGISALIFPENILRSELSHAAFNTSLTTVIASDWDRQPLSLFYLKISLFFCNSKESAKLSCIFQLAITIFSFCI